MKLEYIIWNGDNTEEVVKFCSDWEYDLCGIYRIATNRLAGKDMLVIEPSDTMRGSCCDIQLGERAIRKERGTYRYIEVKKEETK